MADILKSQQPRVIRPNSASRHAEHALDAHDGTACWALLEMGVRIRKMTGGL